MVNICIRVLISGTPTLRVFDRSCALNSTSEEIKSGLGDRVSWRFLPYILGDPIDPLAV